MNNRFETFREQNKYVPIYPVRYRKKTLFHNKSGGDIENLRFGGYNNRASFLERRYYYNPNASKAVKTGLVSYVALAGLAGVCIAVFAVLSALGHPAFFNHAAAWMQGNVGHAQRWMLIAGSVAVAGGAIAYLALRDKQISKANISYTPIVVPEDRDLTDAQMGGSGKSVRVLPPGLREAVV